MSAERGQTILKTEADHGGLRMLSGAGVKNHNPKSKECHEMAILRFKMASAVVRLLSLGTAGTGRFSCKRLRYVAAKSGDLRPDFRLSTLRRS